MQLPVAVFHPITAAQRIQIVLLPRMLLPRHYQGIEHAAALLHGPIAAAKAAQLVVEEAHIERGVMDHQLRTIHKGEEFIRHLVESGFVRQELGADAVNGQRSFIDLALRIEIQMQAVAGEATINHFYTTNLDHPVAIIGLKAGGFRIQYYLTH